MAADCINNSSYGGNMFILQDILVRIDSKSMLYMVCIFISEIKVVFACGQYRLNDLYKSFYQQLPAILESELIQPH